MEDKTKEKLEKGVDAVVITCIILMSIVVLLTNTLIGNIGILLMAMFTVENNINIQLEIYLLMMFGVFFIAIYYYLAVVRMFKGLYHSYKSELKHSRERRRLKKLNESVKP